MSNPKTIIFLSLLKKTEENKKRLEKISGPGFKKKIKRLFSFPKLYFYSLLFKLGVLGRRERDIKLVFGKFIRIPVLDWESFRIFVFGFPSGNDEEFRLVKYLIKNLQGNDVFFDIGANYGFYTYLAQEICKKVCSFEPNTKVFYFLLKNGKRENTFIENLAISSFTGRSKLYTSKENSGISTLNKDTVNMKEWESWNYSESHNINTITLDSYIKSKNITPSVLKIDVEGGEKSVLEGGEIFLRSNSPIVILEVWSGNMGKNISMKAVGLLRNMGYKSHYIDENGDIHEIEGDLSNIKEYGGNFVFKK